MLWVAWLHLPWFNTRLWSRPGGVFCSQNSWTVVQHRKPCRGLLRERRWLEQLKPQLLSTFPHCAHAWQELAVESSWGPYTMNLCDTQSKCHVWERQLTVPFLSPLPCTAHLPTACKKILITLLPLSPSSLNDLSMQLSGSLPGFQQTDSSSGQEGRSITRRLGKLQLWSSRHAPSNSSSRETRMYTIAG